MLVLRNSLEKVPVRIAAIAALLFLELVPLTIAVDTGYLRVDNGLAGLAARTGANVLRMLLLASVMTWIFAVRSGPAGWMAELGRTRRWRFSPRALAVHVFALAAFAIACIRLFQPGTQQPVADRLAALVFAAGATTVVSAAITFVPLAFWTALWRRAAWAPVGGLVLALSVVALNAQARWIAEPWLRLTFDVSSALIHLVKPSVVIHAAQYDIVGRLFDVTVNWQCSGYEGVLLILFFGSAWLAVFRRDFRFPRALLLLPAGVVAIWVLNCARIVGIFLIGDAGAPEIAARGFHSQAGWISFVTLSIVFCIAAQRLPWFSAVRRVEATPSAADPTAAYLGPFLAILAASLVAQAASSGFEWAYPLRVLCAAIALWSFRRAYADLDWSVRTGGVLIGLLVFAIWVGAERFLIPGSVPMAAPAAFAAASTGARWTWLLFRLAGGIVTVPIAEELAFRGFALRRIESPDFASVDLRRFGWTAFLVSSLVFGALHGRRWVVGAIAGMLFAGAVRRRGSIGDAVAAHAVANLLLAAYALATGDWRFW
jgi:exosortase E/protease (VPEID-CTERM system)